MPESSKDLLPNLLLPGFPKCGTTSIAETLSGHPEVATARPHRATHYFTPRFYDPEAPLPTLDEYEGHFTHAATAKVRLDDTVVWAYGGKRLASQINAVLPQSRVLIMLREPASRTASYLTWKKRNAQVSQDMTLAEYVAKCEELGPRSVDTEELNAWSGLFGSEYERFLPAWSSEYGDRLRIGFMEDLRDRPIEFYTALAEWLQLDASYFTAENLKIANPAQGIRNARLEKVVRWVGRRAQYLAHNYPTIYSRLRDAARAVNRAPSPETIDIPHNFDKRFEHTITNVSGLVSGRTLLPEPPSWAKYSLH